MVPSRLSISLHFLLNFDSGTGKYSERKLKALQLISEQSESVTDHVLCRRAELLVRAAYILTGLSVRSPTLSVLIS
jgi:hypothetical protein